MSILHIFLKADDGKALKGPRLVNHLVEVVGVVEGPSVCRVWIFFGRSARTAARAVLLLVTARLLHEVGGFINLGTLQDLGFDGIGG